MTSADLVLTVLLAVICGWGAVHGVLALFRWVSIPSRIFQPEEPSEWLPEPKNARTQAITTPPARSRAESEVFTRYQSAEAELEETRRITRMAMNEAAGKGWRNLAE